MTLGDVGETQTPSAKHQWGCHGRVTKTRVCLSAPTCYIPSVYPEDLSHNLFISSPPKKGGASSLPVLQMGK